MPYGLRLWVAILVMIIIIRPDTSVTMTDGVITMGFPSAFSLWHNQCVYGKGSKPNSRSLSFALLSTIEQERMQSVTTSVYKAMPPPHSVMSHTQYRYTRVHAHSYTAKCNTLRSELT